MSNKKNHKQLLGESLLVGWAKIILPSLDWPKRVTRELERFAKVYASFAERDEYVSDLGIDFGVRTLAADHTQYVITLPDKMRILVIDHGEKSTVELYIGTAGGSLKGTVEQAAKVVRDKARKTKPKRERSPEFEPYYRQLVESNFDRKVRLKLRNDYQTRFPNNPEAGENFMRNMRRYEKEYKKGRADASTRKLK